MLCTSAMDFFFRFSFLLKKETVHFNNYLFDRFYTYIHNKLCRYLANIYALPNVAVCWRLCHRLPLIGFSPLNGDVQRPKKKKTIPLMRKNNHKNYEKYVGFHFTNFAIHFFSFMLICVSCLYILSKS